EVIVDLIPRTNSNRPGTPLHPSKVTIHNTDNDSPGADAHAHAQYMKGPDAQARKVSWHFTVDDRSIYQSLPVDEVGWHAGTQEGNRRSIGIEICENRGIDQAAANERAARLTALQLHDLGLDPAHDVVQHHDWSGKDCPQLLRNSPSGWTDFLARIRAHYDGIAAAPHENLHAAPVIPIRLAEPEVEIRRALPVEIRRALPVLPTPTGTLDSILQIAADSDIARYEWLGRGRAPIGYIKGMALTFGRVYCKWKAGGPAAQEMAKAVTSDPGRDALAYYRAQFAELGMDNSVAGADTLRHVFALLLGLGMRESSGNYCEGRDTTAENTTADTAEAGMFQMSFNARSAHPVMPQLFAQYSANPGSGFLEVFKEGAHCHASDFQNFGTGPGRDFQELCKTCPAFAAEFAAVGLRNIRRHWGPINTQKAQVRAASDELFKRVQAAVDSEGLCPLLHV
ncbi:MAG TPA: N-acetylmuramoyl-L-alanine amidase, partial [Chthoniobacterales bacterium]